MKGYRHLPLFFLFILTSTLISPVVATLPTPLFILGDSTTICGDNTFYPLLPPDLTSCLASRHRYLPNLLAEKLNLPPLPPFNSGNFSRDTLTTGINFGSSPGTIITGDSDSSLGVDRIFRGKSLSLQVRQVYEVLQSLNLQVGPTEGHRVTQSGVFVVSFGTDDYLEMFGNGGSKAVALKYGRKGLARVLVSQMVKAITDLYNADVRKIACIGVVPLGCAPRIVYEGMNELEGRNCLDEVNDVISSYNSKLSDRILKLPTQLPGLQIVFCDVYGGIMEIISNPLAYGFKNVRDACCGVGMYRGMIGCLTNDMACNDSSSFIWWDFYSTTEAANTLLANWSWAPPDPKLQICSPITLHQLAFS